MMPDALKVFLDTTLSPDSHATISLFGDSNIRALGVPPSTKAFRDDKGGTSVMRVASIEFGRIMISAQDSRAATPDEIAAVNAKIASGWPCLYPGSYCIPLELL